MSVLSSCSDSELLLKVRSGDSAAYGALWERHSAAIRHAARSFTGFDPDDVTAEAFARILRTIGNGFGPTDFFRPYALLAARNIAIEWSRAKVDLPLDTAVNVVDPKLDDFMSRLADDRTLAIVAFRALPDRWREVLWYTEVEAMQPAEIAPIIGMTPNSVAALAVRAREGLRQAWIEAHIDTSTLGPEHARIVSQASKYARGKLSTAAVAKVETHLTACGVCAAAFDEVKSANSLLAMSLLPLLLGAGPAAWYMSVRDTNGGSGSGPGTAAATAGSGLRARRTRIVVIAAAGVVLLGSAAGFALAPSAPEQPSVQGTDGIASQDDESVDHGAGSPAQDSNDDGVPDRGGALEEPDRGLDAAVPDPVRAEPSPEAATTPPAASSAPSAPSGAVPGEIPAAPTVEIAQTAGHLLPIARGTARPFSTVTVVATNIADARRTVWTTSADSTGFWKALVDVGTSGTFAITATQTTRAGATSAATAESLTTVRDDLQVALTPRADSNGFRLHLSGVPGASVEMLSSGSTVAVVVLDQAGGGDFIQQTGLSAAPRITGVRYVAGSERGFINMVTVP